jgi:hypothetical protein
VAAAQEVAARLAAAGHRVLYVENTDIRAPRLSDIRRAVQRLRRWRRTSGMEIRSGLSVFAPLVLPPFGSRLRRALNRAVFLPAVRRRAFAMEMRDPVVIAWLPTDTALDLAGLPSLPHRTLVYFCTADFEPLAPRAARLRVAELELMSDLIVAAEPYGCVVASRAAPA